MRFNVLSVYMNIFESIKFVFSFWWGRIRKHDLCYFLFKLRASMVLKWIPNCLKMNSGNKFRKNLLLMISSDFFEKRQNNLLPGSLNRDPYENYSNRFPEVV